LLLPTSPAFITALAASDGRAAVLINTLAAPAEIAFQCRDANVGAIFTTSALAARVPDGIPLVLLDDAPRAARVLIDGRTHEVDLGSHHGLSITGERDVEGRDEEGVIIYTSAMRGTPAGAVLTHANLLANARSMVNVLAASSDDHVLAVLPYAHLFGLTVTGIVPLLVGSRVTTMERFHPSNVVELLAGGDFTAFVAVPSVYYALLKKMMQRGISLKGSALRLCGCGGAALPVELQDRWADVTGMELRQGYGLTEAGPVCLFNRVDRPNFRGALGVDIPGVEVGIFPPAEYTQDDAKLDVVAPLADGEQGEICVRGANVSPGYVGGASGLWRRGEWLCTGDLGVRGPDGSVRFLGLLKPMFTRNGFNVYPREVERIVREMPGVTSAEVSPIPDLYKENGIRLRVSGSVTEGDVKAWCEQRLSAYKQPSEILQY
jgi:long-chain acyl-CoA synthetase